MSGQVSSESQNDVEPWDARAIVRSINPVEARLSNGFLRCHPERWFPGLSESWAPLMNTLGCEFRLVEIKPQMGLPSSSELCFRGLFDQESIAIVIDSQSADLIAREVVPRSVHGAHNDLVLEYLFQRFMAGLGTSQTISEAGQVIFSGRADSRDLRLVAAVKLSCTINSAPCHIVVGLGHETVEKMDKLWRRQVHSSTRNAQPEGPVRLELAQLAIPPQMLSEYLSKGTVIDLEERVSDLITLRVGHKPFMPARMVEVEGKLACQTISGAATNIVSPEGTSRLSIELASIPADSALLAELGQVGAIAITDVTPGANVTLSINQERVGEAKLCIYQGRHAVEVI